MGDDHRVSRTTGLGQLFEHIRSAPIMARAEKLLAKCTAEKFDLLVQRQHLDKSVEPPKARRRRGKAAG
jgi:hypothetical protein